MTDKRMEFYRRVYKTEAKKLDAVTRKIFEESRLKNHVLVPADLAIAGEQIARRMSILLAQLLKE